MFYNFYRLLKQRQESIIREISLRSNWITFSGRSKLICFCRQVAVAYTEVCTDSLFLLMKGHRWFEGRGCGESGDTKCAGCVRNTCWPLPFSEPLAPPGIWAQTTQDSLAFCARQEPKTLPKSTSCKKHFSPSNHLNVLHHQIAKKKSKKQQQQHLTFHFKHFCLLILKVLRKTLCWSSSIPQSSPDDDYLLLSRSFLGSFGVCSGVDRSALPLAASYSASVSPNFFLSKKNSNIYLKVF